MHQIIASLTFGYGVGPRYHAPQISERVRVQGHIKKDFEWNVYQKHIIASWVGGGLLVYLTSSQPPVLIPWEK